jgi:hypothetical protein
MRRDWSIDGSKEDEQKSKGVRCELQTRALKLELEAARHSVRNGMQAEAFNARISPGILSRARNQLFQLRRPNNRVGSCLPFLRRQSA